MKVIIIISFALFMVGCSFNYVERGNFYESRGDYSMALESYRKALNQDTQNINVILCIANIHMKFGEYKKAIEILNSARRLANKMDPIHAEISYRLGYCHYELDDNENAIAELKNSVALGGDMKAHYYLGATYLREKDYGLAAKEFRTTLEKEDFPGAHYYLAASYWGLGTHQTLELAKDELKLAIRNATEEKLNEKCSKLQKKVQERLDKIGQKIADLRLEKRIFSCIYEYYNHNPIGILYLQNKAEETMYNIRTDVDVKGYGVFPQEIAISDLPPGEKAQINLFTNFTDDILKSTFTTNQSVTVKLRYDVVGLDGEKNTEEETITGELTLYDKNSMVWTEPLSGMVSAFVTHTDKSVESFTRGSISTSMQRPFDKAMEIYSALDIYGIEYSSDASPIENNIDRVFYPREMMALKKGDCDDLSVLYSACLENLGINTAFIFVPGHVFMMFDTGIHLKNAADFLLGSDWYIQIRGSNHAWVPVETTFIGQEGKGFFHAWEEGSRKYRNLAMKGEVEKVIQTHEAWADFKPISLQDSPVISPISAERIQAECVKTSQEIGGKRTQILRERIQTYLRELEISPQNASLHNGLGISYAKLGILNESAEDFIRAEEHFKKALLMEGWLSSPHTNLGNVILIQSNNERELEEAEKHYDEAIKRGEAACVYINKMMLHIIRGDRHKAVESLTMALDFYTPEEIQTIFGISIEDLGLVKKDEAVKGNVVSKSVQDLLRQLEKARSEKKVKEQPKQKDDKAKVEADISSKAERMSDLRDILKKALTESIPEKPDEPIGSGGVRGADNKLMEIPLLLYWSDVRID